MVHLKIANYEELQAQISKVDEISSIMLSISSALRSIISKHGWHSGFDKGERDLPAFVIRRSTEGSSTSETTVSPTVVDGYVDDVDVAELQRVMVSIDASLSKLERLYQRLDVFKESNVRTLPILHDVDVTYNGGLFVFAKNQSRTSFANLAEMRTWITEHTVASDRADMSLSRSFARAGFGSDFDDGTTTLFRNNSFKMALVFIKDLNLIIPVIYLANTEEYPNKWYAIFPSDDLHGLSCMGVVYSTGDVTEYNPSYHYSLTIEDVTSISLTPSIDNAPYSIGYSTETSLPVGTEVDVNVDNISFDRIDPNVQSSHIDRKYPVE
jgi:hypothetical protein